MKLHHLNCGTMRPWGIPDPREAVCHCLLLETGDGLVLVDSGLGLGDVRQPNARLGRFFRIMTRPVLDEGETAIRRIEAMGFRGSDVRDVVLTHLDLDHAGGLGDFPEARVHVLAAEHEAAMTRPSFIERRRYRDAHWAHGAHWRLYPDQGDDWFGFTAVRPLDGLPEEIALIPVAGHARGHAGVAVKSEAGWLLHAGDAYYYRGEMDVRRPTCPLLIRTFQRIFEIDRAARLANQERLRELLRKREGEVDIFSAHDPVELAALSSAENGACSWAANRSIIGRVT